MDPITSLALTLALAAVGFYVLYWTVRKAVAGGIRDARSDAQAQPTHGGAGAPRS